MQLEIKKKNNWMQLEIRGGKQLDAIEKQKGNKLIYEINCIQKVK